VTTSLTTTTDEEDIENKTQIPLFFLPVFYFVHSPFFLLN
jgi:hypothetical protein